MQYKIIAQQTKNWYEATSFYQRKNDSDEWEKLKRPEENSLEETIVKASLNIVHDMHKKRKRTHVIINID